MASLFSGRVLIRNNSDQDELDTEAELSRRLENRLVLLFFGAGSCPQCQAFAPILRDFFVRLTDEFYVLRAAQLALVYVSQDPTEEEQDLFLRDMPKKWLFLPFEDDLRRDLGRQFSVERLPAVVVLKPGGDVLTRDATDEIRRLGPACPGRPRPPGPPASRCYRVDQAARGKRRPRRGSDPEGEGGAEGGVGELF
uniref:Nucleoredoxin like 1 n=1 Tax=Panthera tigris altaica TaxID=74533 RepID=A0A8C9JSA5_PANTA